jgi:predicted nucleic acid-binding protein
MARLGAVADSAPLIAATNRRDRAHRLAALLVAELGRSLLIPLPVMTEVDYLLRSRAGPDAARSFLEAVVGGVHQVVFMSSGLLRRAAELDRRYADLSLGLADTSVMAVAERHELPILTFDFADFRATAPARGHWRLLLDETRFERAIRQGS